MLKINIVAVGRVKEGYYSQAIDEYKKRLSRFCEFKIIEISEHNFSSAPTKPEIAIITESEGEEILKRIKGNAIALCIEGKKLDSLGFANLIESAVNDGAELSFIIGGSHGLGMNVKNSAKQIISMSDMTFPHTLFRVLLTEQIYRAFMINSKSSYHK